MKGINWLLAYIIYPTSTQLKIYEYTIKGIIWGYIFGTIG